MANFDGLCLECDAPVLLGHFDTRQSGQPGAMKSAVHMFSILEHRYIYT